MTAIPTRGERETLIGYLEHYRDTLERQCADLTPAQLAIKAVPPSNISLLGLVRHLGRVEHNWCRRVIEGHPELPRPFDDEDAGFDFAAVDAGLIADAWALWRGEVERAREVLGRTEFDLIVEVHGQEIEVRDVIVHLIEEYARHCGHADLIREVIDGRTDC